MNILSYVTLFICFRAAFSLSDASEVDGSDASISIEPCAAEEQQYSGGSSQLYIVGKDDVLKYGLKLTEITIPPGEQLIIKTLDCEPDEDCTVAVLRSRAKAPVSITMEERSFTLFSSSSLVSASFRINHECLNLCITASCDPGKGDPIKEGSSWRCICKPGYHNPVGDNKTCVDVDECTNGDTSSCLPGTGSCTNVEGSWRCHCLKGYTHPIDGNQQICEDVNECEFGIITSCGTDSANCTNLPGSYRCECGDRYTNPPDNNETCVEILCGTNFTTEEGVIDYPQFGGKYPKNDRCILQVTTTPGKKLKLNFTRFDVRTHASCKFDSLEVFDDATPGSPRYGLFCGRKAPEGGELITSGNYIRFDFKSTFIPGSTGFAVHWTTVDDYCVNQDTTSLCEAGTGECVNGETPGTWRCDCNAGYQNPAGNNHVCIENVCGNFTTEEGVLDYPDGLGIYKPNQNCIWHFSTTPGKKLRLFFTQFNLEFPIPCYFDYLEILDGLTAGSPSLGKFSGNEKPGDERFFTNNNTMRLAFKSDSTVESVGFRVVWNTVEPNGLCGNFRAKEGEIDFPKGGKVHENEDFCNWHISTSPGKNLSLNFTRFDLEYQEFLGGLICYDTVMIYDPANSTSGRTYCKYPPPPEFNFTNSIRIEYKSHWYTKKRGFKVHWITV